MWKIRRLPHPLLQCTLFSIVALGLQNSWAEDNLKNNSGYSGSVSCIECHDHFYELWSTSHHGLAMQPYTRDFSKKELTPQQDAIQIGNQSYSAKIGPDEGWVAESGPEGEKKYPIEHVMGGKNVYYFLTTLERGRLQTLPLAYDVNKKKWYDTAASGVRHFPGVLDDEPLHWTDRAYTFNTSCFNCHVSQLATNYDFKNDSYHTVWAEPGINCETCHGPAGEHVKACKEAPAGEPPQDLRLKTVTVSRGYTTEQVNTACAPCHAKMRPLTNAMEPGDLFFDHYDLVALEHADFYPDGRDLGENYTYTSWLMSPCVKSGELDCMHCHTSSGRYRHKDDPDQSCLPCHQDRVEEAVEHHHHPEGKAGSHCIDCHMPMTRFAAMNRTDHSMLPPTPAATLKFESPNACNLCHDDHDAEWADKWVREWRDEDYQEPILYRAGLIDSARKGEWDRLPDMLDYLTSEDRDEVFSVSLIRLLETCPKEEKFGGLLKAMEDPSPFVRSAAAAGLSGYFTPDAVMALIEASTDEFRLVRIQAAGALVGFPVGDLPNRQRDALIKATKELFDSLTSRPDDWSSYYNLGNIYLTQGRVKESVEAFGDAHQLRPDAVLPLVNTSIAYARLGEEEKSETALRKALKIAPKNSAANFNLGLLLAGKGETEEAEWCLRNALETDPKMDRAAYNLGLLLAAEKPAEALDWLRKAHEIRPEIPEYSYTMAFYQIQNGAEEKGVQTLLAMVDAKMNYPDAYLLLIDLFKKEGKQDQVSDIVKKAMENSNLPIRFRQQISMMHGASN
ncbi:MAG: ammonia-forming cytochrome c nitrite reductase subunit c552 [Candidatus Omnitrophica bacterium]|nr:ammonia-forming cytochrome c nitrite reductase subunit c552 [Candidatus Omnitrophota bacterium]